MSNQFHLRLKAIHQAIADIPQAAVDAASQKLALEHGVVADAIKLIHSAASDVDALKAALGTTQADLAQLKAQVATYPADVVALTTRVTSSEADVQKLNLELQSLQGKTDTRLECLCALCEVAEILWRWEGEKGQEHGAELSSVHNKYRQSIANVAEHHLDDWGKLCGELPKAATPEKRAQRGHLLRKIARAVCGISE
jgi:ABC-type transporter Mla subunit MlaD